MEACIVTCWKCSIKNLQGQNGTEPVSISTSTWMDLHQHQTHVLVQDKEAEDICVFQCAKFSVTEHVC